ncbi:hypothetical protein AwDysgo_08190 [Bacteroidales bacterium]|nr:hypothetical protein AwDysgo_08190 [Bacteroidales bacterium]
MNNTFMLSKCIKAKYKLHKFTYIFLNLMYIIAKKTCSNLVLDGILKYLTFDISLVIPKFPSVKHYQGQVNKYTKTNGG